MERHKVWLGIAIAALCLLSITATASARRTHARHSTKPATSISSETCIVAAEPSSFVESGEFSTASSIADIISVECQPVYAEKYVKIGATELYNRCNQHLLWTEGGPSTTGPSYTIRLDNDGNGGAIVFGGPSCAAGESLITAHLESPPYTTVAADFTVLPPVPTEVGVKAEPEITVEGEETSSVATIVKVEFPPVFAEEPVVINASQLQARCHISPKIIWAGFTPNGTPGLIAPPGSEEAEVWLDNDGNAFAVLIGASSCAAGTSLIEASLVNAPYTTKTGDFTILPPQPTIPPAAGEG